MGVISYRINATQIFPGYGLQVKYQGKDEEN